MIVEKNKDKKITTKTSFLLFRKPKCLKSDINTDYSDQKSMFSCLLKVNSHEWKSFHLPNIPTIVSGSLEHQKVSKRIHLNIL